jgi:cytochrome P450
MYWINSGRQNQVKSSRKTRFPLGHDITLDELERDPYPVFARLREQEPISWVAALNMWYVVGYEDVRTALLDSSHLTTASAQSTIFDTFGAHMLTTEGEVHDRYRRATRHAFTPGYVREHLEPAISATASDLVKAFEKQGRVELRAAFAARLPIQVMLRLCGLPAQAETQMRGWYDSFEAALANFTGDPAIRGRAQRSVAEFHSRLDDAIDSVSAETDEHSLLAHLVRAPAAERLSNDEIKRNLSIIFFGGISTVEALLLNCLWALFEHPEALERVQGDHGVLPQAIEETMRWMSPVQSATRHVTAAFEWRGIEFAAHETVNCMLGAANRDPSIFSAPDRFNLDRENCRRHLGFATGAHACLGSHLAKTEVRIGLATLLGRLENMRLHRLESESPRGYEFRQPRKLTVSWDP